MTPEERKEYNKTYYKNNREVILNKSKIKAVCDLCNRVVSEDHLKQHKASKLCMNRQKYNALFLNNN